MAIVGQNWDVFVGSGKLPDKTPAKTTSAHLCDLRTCLNENWPKILTDAAESLLAEPHEHGETEVAVGGPVEVFQPPQVVAVILHVLRGEQAPFETYQYTGVPWVGPASAQGSPALFHFQFHQSLGGPQANSSAQMCSKH